MKRSFNNVMSNISSMKRSFSNVSSNISSMKLSLNIASSNTSSSKRRLSGIFIKYNISRMKSISSFIIVRNNLYSMKRSRGMNLV